MNFPLTRMRRLRKSTGLRKMTTETHLRIEDLVAPLFVRPGKGLRNEITSMPGQYQLSPDEAAIEAGELHKIGIPAMILFGIPEKKNEKGSRAYAPDGIVQETVKIIREKVQEMVVITDVCLCEYTDHGHCGMVRKSGTGFEVDNDSSLELLARTAVSQAEAGAHVVAPSAMMDGQVAAIRSALDEAGYQDTAIMAYSAKYASSFYGPFRDAAESPPQFGDRCAYQMNPANIREALRELELDISEGADVVMVKPALAYLDVISMAREFTELPVACYNVSGEYSMVKAAAQRGWVDEKEIVMEILTGFKRAGADLIISYHARDAAFWLS